MRYQENGFSPFARQEVVMRDPLTLRQRQVFHLKSLGLTEKEIAQELGIAYETVRAHVTAIRENLDREPLAKLVFQAFRNDPVLFDEAASRLDMDEIQRNASRLTPRQRTVLEELTHGEDPSDNGIARALEISYETVRTHMVNVNTVFDCNNRIEAGIAYLALKRDGKLPQ